MPGSGRWPDFFLVGAPKAGTTALYEHLAATPGICIPVKEPHHFDAGIDRSMFFTRPIDDVGAYQALFAGCAESSVAGECTPTYLVDPSTPGRIASVVPEARILAVIRDPVERAVSHFRFREARVGRDDRSLSAAIVASQLAAPADYTHSYLVHAGRYSDGLNRYVAAFGADRVHVVFFEDLVNDPAAVVRSCTAHLGVEYSGLAELGWRDRNAAARPRGRWAASLLRNRTARFIAQRLPAASMQWLGRRVLMEPAVPVALDDESRRLLEDEYRGEADAIERLIGRRPTWSWDAGHQA